MLEVANLKKTFGGIHALTGVSLTARPGRVLGLIGENGAGKSTIVRCLTGIHRPSAGDIRIDGNAQDFRRPQDAAAAGLLAEPARSLASRWRF
ncbi:ATP-binding cassette domain-containing protein [Marinovum sp. 2_MG-2023]|uniref:ATP-binding cassette domain-containing protein n=1 Tax=unclassified Marinovum TaxID=2647166 RepID=UPI0026E2C1D7|nr:MULTISPECIES: ATP-binding cassette domain-containing protein [unclassified Marinovum]MDO6729269.1 ATP-binding cassette domain-containing protein [Marinovum sp. 2_MG-2023]MDO6779104.1 ATP-binding cassette domain-containing protein [Marinovum sp. 1_MG-2023]